MRLDTTELDTMPAATAEDLAPTPTWAESFKASTKAMAATGVSTSKHNYRYDTFKSQIEELQKSDPENASAYNPLLMSSYGNIKMFDMMYEAGGIDNVAKYKDEATAKSYDLYRKKVLELNLKDIDTIEQESDLRAKTDYEEAQKVLNESEYLSAQLAGTVVGGIQDPLTAITIPFGGAAVRGAETTFRTALNVGLREMAVSAYTEPMIATVEYDYKNDLEIKHSIGDAAVNAIAGTMMPGLIRFTGSATVDLTTDGIKALRKSDPDLADEYTSLYSKKITDSDEEHLVNLTRVENGDMPNVPKNPTPEMQDIMKSGPQKEYTFIEKTEPPKRTYEAEEIYVGQDADGNAITKSYKDMTDEFDAEAGYLKQIEDCILKGGV